MNDKLGLDAINIFNVNLRYANFKAFWFVEKFE